MINTGDIIRESRKAAGLLQKELAQKAVVSERTIGRWETGESNLDVLESILDVLGYDIIIAKRDGLDIGAEIRRRRKAKKMSQEELADVGLTSCTELSRIEMGKKSPSIDYLRPVLDALGCRLAIVEA